MISKELREEIRHAKLKNELEKGIDYYIEYAPIEELQEQFEWYGVNNIHNLKNIMYESYLETYTDKELKERIKMLYEE